MRATPPVTKGGTYTAPGLHMRGPRAQPVKHVMIAPAHVYAWAKILALTEC